MAWIAAAVLASGALAANSASEASDAQTNAANKAGALTQAQFDQNRQDQTPWRTQGTAAINRLGYLMGTSPMGANASPLDEALASGQLVEGNGYAIHPVQALWDSSPEYRQAWKAMEDAYSRGEGAFNTSTGANYIAQTLKQNGYTGSRAQPQVPQGADFGSLARGFTMDDLKNDPVYQAAYDSGLKLGTQALTRRQVAPGGAGWDSGAAAKELTRYGTDYTNQFAGQSFDRWNTQKTNQFNRLAAIAGVGQQSVQATGQTGAQAAGTIGNLITGAGNAQAAAGMYGTNAMIGSVNSAGNYWQQQQMLNMMKQRGGYGGGQTAGIDMNMAAG